MSGIAWLHLSDWHMRSPDFDRGVVRDELLAKELILANLEWLPLKGRAHRQQATPQDAPLLTEAQVRVLTLIRQGLRPEQIAKDHGTSVNTVYVQLRDARRRLAAATTEEAVQKAVSLGLIETS